MWAVFFLTLSNNKNEEVCIRGYDVKLFLDDKEYGPHREAMIAYRDEVLNGTLEFPGYFDSICIAAKDSLDTFVIFDTPVNADTFSLLIDEGSGELEGEWAFGETVEARAMATQTALDNMVSGVIRDDVKLPDPNADSTTALEMQMELMRVCNEEIQEVLPLLELNQNSLRNLDASLENVAALTSDLRVASNQNLFNGAAMRACMLGMDWKATFSEAINFANSYEFTFEFVEVELLTDVESLMVAPAVSSEFIQVQPTRAEPTTEPTEEATAVTRTYYAVSNANLRSCAKVSSDCPVVTTVSFGDSLSVIRTEKGDSFQDSAFWYVLDFNGQELFIHTSLASLTKPQPVNTTSSGNSSENSSSSPTAISTPPPNNSATCPGFNYTCSQLTCEQAYACLAAGNQQLDRDNDGVPCESVCPGG